MLKNQRAIIKILKSLPIHPKLMELLKCTNLKIILSPAYVQFYYHTLSGKKLPVQGGCIAYYSRESHTIMLQATEVVNASKFREFLLNEISHASISAINMARLSSEATKGSALPALGFDGKIDPSKFKKIEDAQRSFINTMQKFIDIFDRKNSGSGAGLSGWWSNKVSDDEHKFYQEIADVIINYFTSPSLPAKLPLEIYNKFKSNSPSGQNKDTIYVSQSKWNKHLPKNKIRYDLKLTLARVDEKNGVVDVNTNPIPATNTDRIKMFIAYYQYLLNIYDLSASYAEWFEKKLSYYLNGKVTYYAVHQAYSEKTSEQKQAEFISHIFMLHPKILEKVAPEYCEILSDTYSIDSYCRTATL